MTALNILGENWERGLECRRTVDLEACNCCARKESRRFVENTDLTRAGSERKHIRYYDGNPESTVPAYQVQYKNTTARRKPDYQSECTTSRR